MSKLELWGGHECTVNRIDDVFIDQTVRSGHDARASDIDDFTALGLKAIRYPVLWERVAPHEPGRCDWSWTDERLARLRDIDLRVIAGLVHHGSGPRYVDLLSPDFAPGLARHAAQAAERYPWIADWAPVNEPLTTARFSALYGHWYPHARNERLFWLALLNQIDATRLAMREVRRVNAKARLVQTEDLGRTYSVRALAQQAGFERVRRWMTWDLLSGRVTNRHPLWKRLQRFGFGDHLRRIADDPCAPDILGVNHYLTSDRFLDTRCDRYPGVPVGGNGKERYVDVEAVRVMAVAPAGLENACREAWRRYRIPIVLTEVHNGCTREEQVRWFADAWASARRLRREGVDMRAVTAWSLLGAYDWDSLLTRRRGRYESGAFDVSSGAARATALAHFLTKLGADERAKSDLGGDGWWRRDIRLVHPPTAIAIRGASYKPANRRGAPLLILGASGTLGQALSRACSLRDLDCVITSRAQLSLCDEGKLAKTLLEIKPRAVINATGWVRVDDAEREAEACRKANTEGAVMLACGCAERGVRSVTFSSDLVFDGVAGRPYLEADAPNPLNIYGASKADAERAILALGVNALIVRTAAFFSPHDPHNFAAWLVRELRAGGLAECASDLVVSPTYTPALANAVLDLVIDQESGLWHLSNGAGVSWSDFGQLVARAAKLDTERVRPRPAQDLGWRARRPVYSALGSARGKLLPELDESVAEFAGALAQSARVVDQARRQACTA
ncbi:MAG TPA: sugar nucleotide-binding protein [Candidatus Binatia bacterium]|nr:sugar nucleotide-binding protein [Candidatus Binatia bacterium]